MVGSGRFRLDIMDGDKVLASRKFWSGWGRSGGDNEAPDRLEVNTVNEIVKSGDEVKLTVRTPYACLLYTSPSPRDQRGTRMPSSA